MSIADLKPGPADTRAAAPPLIEAVRALFNSGVAVAITDPRMTYPPGFAAEIAAMARATPARRREFAAGRAALHRAMADLGHAPRPVLAGADRAPVWPDSVVGSLSHSATTCVAVMGEARALRSLGVDVEEDTALDDDLIPQICTLAERAWLASQPGDRRARLAKLIFSAKECAYKCQYPLTSTGFDFDTLEITPDIDTGQFEATFTRDIGQFVAGHCLHGRFVIRDGLIVTGTMLTHRPRWSIQGR